MTLGGQAARRLPAARRAHDPGRGARRTLARDARGLPLRRRWSAHPGATEDRDLSWLNTSHARALSQDGRTLLFAETAAGSQLRGVPPQDRRLARGAAGGGMAARPVRRRQVGARRGPVASAPARDLSHGRRRDAGISIGRRSRLRRARSGSGTAARPDLRQRAGKGPALLRPGRGWGRSPPGHPGGARGTACSPRTAPRSWRGDPGGATRSTRSTGGEPRPVPGLAETDSIAHWSPDGRSVLAYRRAEIPCRLERVVLDERRAHALQGARARGPRRPAVAARRLRHRRPALVRVHDLPPGLEPVRVGTRRVNHLLPDPADGVDR